MGLKLGLAVGIANLLVGLMLDILVGFVITAGARVGAIPVEVQKTWASVMYKLGAYTNIHTGALASEGTVAVTENGQSWTEEEELAIP